VNGLGASALAAGADRHRCVMGRATTDGAMMRAAVMGGAMMDPARARPA
jgi:hypothetical protein